MHGIRNRRIVRHAGMGVALCILLLVGNVGSFAAIQFAHGAGIFPNVSPNGLLAILCRPLGWYVDDSGLPGGELIEDLAFSAFEAGTSLRHGPPPGATPVRSNSN